MTDYLRWVGNSDVSYGSNRRYDIESYHVPSREPIMSRSFSGAPRAVSALSYSSRYDSFSNTQRDSSAALTYTRPVVSSGMGERYPSSPSALPLSNYSPSKPYDSVPLNRGRFAVERATYQPSPYRGTIRYADREAIDSQVPAALRAGQGFTPYRGDNREARSNTSVPKIQTADSSFMTQASRYAPSFTPSIRPATANRSSTPTGRIFSSASRASTGLGLLRPSTLSHTRPLLVLDLDETLVHASVERRPSGQDFQFVVRMGKDSVTVFVKVRPFAEEFLRRVSQMFEVCIFTASVSEYADGVLDRLDPQRRFIHHRLYREHCTFTQGSYVKDLSRLGRPLERLCLVDNSPITYAMQPENGVPIVSWFDDMRDAELIHLMPMLEHFSRCGNFYESAKLFGIST